jgi:hypothetical protein
VKLNKTNGKISNFALIRFKFRVNPFYLSLYLSHLPYPDADQGGFAIALSKNPPFHYFKLTFLVQMD